MKNKIAHLMKSESLSSSRLAEILEIQPSAVSHLLSGRNNPRFDMIQKILRRFPAINPGWLFLDGEQMYRDTESMHDANPSSESMSEPMNLFDDDGVFSLDNLMSEVGDSNSSAVSQNGDLVEQNQGSFKGQNRGENSMQNWSNSAPQNMPQNGVKINPQNTLQNAPQNRAINAPSKVENSPCENPYNRPRVERVIVLYSDNTCRTYDMRK